MGKKTAAIIFSILAILLVVTAVVLCIVLIIYATAPTQFAMTYNEKILDNLKVGPYTTEVQSMFPSLELESRWVSWKAMADSAKSFAKEPSVVMTPIEKLGKLASNRLLNQETYNFKQTIWKQHGVVKFQGKLEDGISIDWIYLPEILSVSFMYVDPLSQFKAPSAPGSISYILPFTDGEVQVKSENKKLNEKIDCSSGKGFIARPDTCLFAIDQNYFLVIAFVPKKIKGFVSKFNSTFAQLLDRVHKWKEHSSMSKKFWKQ